MNTIRLICRNSRLAVIQAQEVISGLAGINFHTKFIASYGDKNKHILLTENVEPDFFTRELDQALLKEEADVAVHSAKDLPYPLPEGLELIALTAGLSNADVLVSKNKKKLVELAPGSKVGTSSIERKKQLSALRPDLELVDIRGTIDERIALVEKGKIQALIVAECALQRLSYEHLIAETLPFKTHPLQGNLAVVAKKHNPKLKSIFYPLDIRKNFGKITITGYINGHPEYLSLKALNDLSKTDEIYHDRFVDRAFLNGFSAPKKNIQQYNDWENLAEALYKSAKAGNNISFLFGTSPFGEGSISKINEYLLSRFIYIENILSNNNLLSQKDKKNRILVTGPEKKEYEHLGEVVYSSYDEFKPLNDFKAYKEIFNGREPFNFIVFQNKESVSFFVSALLDNSKDLRWIAGSKVIAKGYTAANDLLKWGIKADIILPDDANHSIVDFFVERQFPGKRVLLAKAKNIGETEVLLLKRMGYFVQVLDLFENISTPSGESPANLDEIDIVAFSSPFGVKQFKIQYTKLPQHVSVISDGEDTKRSLYDTGLLQYEPEWVI